MRRGKPKIHFHRWAGAFTTAVLLTCSPFPVTAQEPELGVKPNQAESKVPNPANGQTLARKLCVTCHVIEPGDGAGQADVPSFAAIANRPHQSTEALMNFLVAPHPPMPDLHLTRQEIRDIAGYILSLRTEN
jgi:mono/diheme cytochrome c family protein